MHPRRAKSNKIGKIKHLPMLPLLVIGITALLLYLSILHHLEPKMLRNDTEAGIPSSSQEYLFIPDAHIELPLTMNSSDLQYSIDSEDGWIGLSSKQMLVAGGENCNATHGALGYLKIDKNPPSPTAERMATLTDGSSIYFEAPQTACNFPNTRVDSVMAVQVQELRTIILPGGKLAK